MKKAILFLFISLSFSFSYAQTQPFLNGGFEHWQKDLFPVFWQHPSLRVSPDSLVKVSGHVSLKAVRSQADVEKNKSPYSLVFQHIGMAYEPADLSGKKVEISVQVKSGVRDTSMHISAFIQKIDPFHPANNGIIFGEDAVSDEWTEASAVMELGELAASTNIATGIIIMGYGELWMDDFRIKVNGKPLEELTPRTTDLTTDEKKWLRKHILSVKEERLSDGKQFGKSFKSARIVGVGDNVHGSSSVFRLKNMAAKALIEREGYTLLAIEDSPTVGEDFNQFVQGKKEALRQEQVNVMYSNEDFKNFLHWLRTYNQSADRKVKIVGVDINSRYKELVSAVNSMTGGKYTSVLDSIVTLLHTNLAKLDARRLNTEVVFNEADRKYISEHLQTIRKDTTQLDQEDQELLLYYIDNLLHYFTFDRVAREKKMADNISGLLAHRPEEKMVYLAHNTHVCNRSNGTKTTGAWLKERYGERYDIVGTCYYEGTDYFKQYALSVSQAPVINESVKGSYEHLFHQLGEECFYLDLKKVRKDQGASAAWLKQPMLMRNYGVEPFNYYYEFTIVDLTEEYDGILFIRESVSI